MVDEPQLAGRGIDRGAFGILEAVREGFARHRRAAEPRIVGRDRPIGFDANDAARKVAPHVGVVREHTAFDAVEVRVVEAECVGARDVHRAVGRERDAPFDAPFDDHFEVFEAAIVH